MQVRMIWAWLFLCAGLVAQAQKAASVPPMPGGLVDVSGYRVHDYCTGSGSPAVMIVGAAFSFDWALVQPGVAKFTRVCTFDPSGTVWSDSFEKAAGVLDANAPSRSRPTCGDRVAEIRRLMTSVAFSSVLSSSVADSSVAGGGPYVLVGFSVGALWARLYDARYPESVAGMVIVDHAFLPDDKTAGTQRAKTSASSGGYSGPVLMTQAPLVSGFEDDENFSKLPERDQELHKWAMTQHPLRPDEAMAADCFSQIDHAVGNRAYPLSDMPLTVIRTENEAPGYAQMQAGLLGLSHRSREVIAWNSSHMVPIDEPEVVVSAIQRSVEEARGKGR